MKSTLILIPSYKTKTNQSIFLTTTVSDVYYLAIIKTIEQQYSDTQDSAISLHTEHWDLL